MAPGAASAWERSPSCQAGSVARAVQAVREARGLCPGLGGSMQLRGERPLGLPQRAPRGGREAPGDPAVMRWASSNID